MRQKKNMFKRREHFTLLNPRCRINYLTGQAFIDWFMAEAAIIINSGHQIEIKMYEHNFKKMPGKSLTDTSKSGIKNKESLPAAGREENMRTNNGVYGRSTFT